MKKDADFMIVKVCTQCNKQYTAQSRAQKFCSRECASAFMVRKVHVTCPVCGKDMYIHKGEKTCCSLKCAGIAAHLAAVVMKTCPVCNAVFESKSKEQKFCSRDCASKGKRRTTPTFTEEQRLHFSENLKAQWRDPKFRQIVVDRMTNHNPVYRPGVVEKANDTRRKNGSCVNNFKYGNGHISHYEELVNNKVAPLGFRYNYAIPTRPAREVEPDAHYSVNYKPDFVNLETKLCIEIDGYGHQSPKEKSIDAKKERCLSLLGYRVIRFTHADIDNGVFDQWLNSYQNNM